MSIYKILVGTDTAFPWSITVEAMSEQVAVDIVADKLEAEKSAFVVDFFELQDSCETGQSAEDYAAENGFVCCGNHSLYMKVEEVVKLPLTDYGEKAFARVIELRESMPIDDFNSALLNWMLDSVENFAAGELYKHHHKAYEIAEGAMNSSYLLNKLPYKELRFDLADVVEELALMILPKELPEREIVLPVTWEMCGKVRIKARNIKDAISKFYEEIDEIELPSSSAYVDGSFGLSTEEIEIIALYNKVDKEN